MNSNTEMEKYLIRHCAPVLAGIKTANLFRYQIQSKMYLLEELEMMSEKLNKKGVYFEIIKHYESSVLIYTYRKDCLETDLRKKENMQLLSRYGYCEMENAGSERGLKEDLSERYLEHLKKRFENSESFPHEIGIFLGYPYEDVKGFIEHKGQNFLFSGIWKVYANPDLARNLFAKFRKCVAVYEKLFDEGKSITALTVAA